MDGWRVFRRQNSGYDGTVTLIHVGVACFMKVNSTNTSTARYAITCLNNFCANQFRNDFASAARSLAADETEWMNGNRDYNGDLTRVKLIRYSFDG